MDSKDPQELVETHFVEAAPAAIGPYSHAASVDPSVGRLVFCSGQTPLDPRTGELIGVDIAAQTEQVFDNLAAVLRGLGGELGHIVKTTVYLSTMENFEGMNRVYARRFGDHRPARTTIAVRENPKGALVEIECIAQIAAAG